MYKRRDWLHLHGEDGGDSSDSDNDSSAAGSQGWSCSAFMQMMCGVVGNHACMHVMHVWQHAKALTQRLRA